MRKIWVASIGIISCILSGNSFAQYYGYGAYRQAYPTGNTPYSSNTMQRAPQAVQQNKGRTIGPLSVGADYVYGAVSYKSKDFDVPSALTDGTDYKGNTRGFNRNMSSVSFNLGFRPLKNIGVEVFYQQSFPKKEVAGVESYSYYPEFARDEYEITYKTYGIDLLGYIPMNDYIEFIATIGVGKYDMEAKTKVIAYEDSSHTKLKSTGITMNDATWAYRLGGGLQFWMSKHLALRVMGRWTNVGGDLVRYITEVNAGVRYHF